MPDGASLYETDFLAWSRQQAEALRAAARTGSNLPLDFENLAEEIEELGRSQRTKLRRRLETIIEHLLKLEFSPARDPRAGWQTSVDRSRLEVVVLLRENPSLRPVLAEALHDARAIATVVARDLERYGETAAAAAVRAHGGAYEGPQVLDDWFPAPPAIGLNPPAPPSG